MSAADVNRILEHITERTGLLKNTIDGRTGMIYNAVKALDAGVDEAEVARLVLAGLEGDALTDAQVQGIVEAIPEAVKQALREGTG